jgi:hypothetical protein
MTTYRGDLPFCLPGQNGMKQEQLGSSSVHHLGLLEGRKSRFPVFPAPKGGLAQALHYSIMAKFDLTRMHQITPVLVQGTGDEPGNQDHNLNTRS